MIDPAMITAIVDRVFNRYPSLTVTETETFAIADQLITELRVAGASTRQIELWALGSAEVFLEDLALSIEQRELCASAILRSCGWELARLDAPAGLCYDFLRATRH